jgi:GH43 family beta-xylosidase
MGRFLFLLITLFVISEATASDKYFTNPILESGADPWIIKHKKSYYYCCVMPGNKIGVSKSESLHIINPVQCVWEAPEKGKWNSTNIWAPELHFYKGKWYIYYAAGYDGPPYIHQRTGVLESVTDNPMGDYIDKGMLFTGDTLNDWDNNFWAIDMTLLEHRGQLYAVWSGWEKHETTDKTQQNLYIAKMKNPTTMSSGRVKISSPVKYYEQGSLPLNEGPQILKNKNSVFIVYSCGQSWLDTYKLAYLKLKSKKADPMNPDSWIKSENSVFEGNENVFGVGHACFTKSPDNKENYIVYHSKTEKKAGWKRDIRIQKFYFDKEGNPLFGEPVLPGIKLPVPSGTKISTIGRNNDFSFLLYSCSYKSLI